MSTTTNLITGQQLLTALGQRLPGRNRLSLPRLAKVTVSVGVGRARENPKLVEIATETLKTITGQRPITTRARKAIAGFKLREGDVVGLQVTLRGRRMWEFVSRLRLVVLPRLRDFRGLARRGFDAQGNYSFGIREHTVFPEVAEENVSILHGVGIVLTTTAATRADGEALIETLGLPLEKPSEGPDAGAGARKE